MEGGLGGHLASGVGDEREAALGDHVEAEVAAAFGPFVGLLGEDGADEAGDRTGDGSVCSRAEDSDHSYTLVCGEPLSRLAAPTHEPIAAPSSDSRRATAIDWPFVDD